RNVITRTSMVATLSKKLPRPGAPPLDPKPSGFPAPRREQLRLAPRRVASTPPGSSHPPRDKGAKGQALRGRPQQAEAKGAVAEAGGVDVASCRPAVPGVVGPATASDNPVPA